ncbi:USP6 N-terminal-like protein isoform X1 [Acyrthosiphon pisum]|uniref:Rab-GAP TBC domain-containing protein n=1 Tax=Acyrthosiphon pisum TaxID=7029 RepID=A0A8R2JQK4_ACYPI|nr:USP6 N-terminal-like protein isoform X1 [Acyrthosiphon pisum]XP_029344087.1 USP6 N-terminal-like protein isoform X1 [Acyrthosiphon pisum]
MNEDEIADKVYEERERIVDLYRNGPGDGTIIDPVDDPTINDYFKLDRFGFIIGDESKFKKEDPQEIKIEVNREQKWLKMISNWDSLSRDKLKRRVYKGIPNSLRGKVWAKLLGVDQLTDDQKNKYKHMCELAWEHSPDVRQIDLDVNRTYREHINFRKRYNFKQQELFNILSAYSIYNLDIGYTQGMSQIAALLLMYLSEDEAFWALSNLISNSKYYMHGFFIPGFPKLIRFQDHHDKIMNKLLPKLKKHLDKNGVETGLYTLKWFFQCFLDRIPFKLTLRVWDTFLLEGDKILSAMAYCLLKLHRHQLYALGMDDILNFLQVKLEQNYQLTADYTIEKLQECLVELKKNKLDNAGQPSQNEKLKRELGIFNPDDIPVRKKMFFQPQINGVGKIRKPINADQIHSSPEQDSQRQGSIITNGKNSLDDVSSIVGDSSRRSLLDTSVTSAATTTVSPQSIQNDDAGSDVTCVSPQPDVLRIYVPYDTPTKKSPTSVSNKITTIQVMDEMATPTVETDGMFKAVSTIN